MLAAILLSAWLAVAPTTACNGDYCENDWDCGAECICQDNACEYA